MRNEWFETDKIPSAKEKVASELQAILESACAGLAAEEGVDISGIRDSYEESKAALEKGDYSQYASQNRDFHSEIWAAAGNKKMENMIAELWNGLSMGNMVTEQEYAKISIEEHCLKQVWQIRSAEWLHFLPRQRDSLSLRS